ncbi:MAG: hypothetical protein V3T77_06145 [Planctomycetota bacterium]
MYYLASIIIFLCGPILAAGLPFVLKKLHLWRYLPTLVPRWPSLPGFLPFSPIRAYGNHPTSRRTAVVQGATLGLAMLSIFLLVGAQPDFSADGYNQVRNAAVAGVLCGVGIIAAHSVLRYLLVARHSALALARLGISGVWCSHEDETLLSKSVRPLVRKADAALNGKDSVTDTEDRQRRCHFARELLKSVDKHKFLAAISVDGLDVFKLLAKTFEHPELGPHGALHGAKIRLLVVPPRCGRMDWQKPSLSCAEAALARIGRSAEEHWRMMKHVLSLRSHWADQYGVQVDFRFMESRPLFACLISGTRVWLNRWPNREQQWIELQLQRENKGLATVVRDHFSSEWSIASVEMEYFLSPEQPGSTAIKKEEFMLQE